jgi:hypothetical protein
LPAEGPSSVALLQLLQQVQNTNEARLARGKVWIDALCMGYQLDFNTVQFPDDMTIALWAGSFQT